MRALSFVFCTLLVLVGCASEDPNIVNPPAGSRLIVVRLFNMIPDGVTRRLVLEQGYQSQDVGQFRFSDTVRSPGDSSFIEIVTAGVTEFKTAQRVRFIQNAVYDVFTLSAIDQPAVFDTLLIANANAALTTVPVAQVRVIDLIPDTARTFDVRLGCPNGSPLTIAPVQFSQASLYREVYPGLVVFSIAETKNGLTNVVGTYECILGERKVYSIVLYRDAASSDALILFIEESDLSAQAERPFVPVQTRTADVRVINVASANANVTMRNTGQAIATSLPPTTLSAITQVPTCESEKADVFEASFSDARTGVDSISLTVRGKYTIVATDSGGAGRLVVAPTIQRPFGSNGKSVIRVINASASSQSIVVSLGARSSASATNGIAAGSTIARDIVFDNSSSPVAVESGLLPLTVSTSASPTSILDITQSVVEPDKNYDIIVYDQGGQPQTLIIEETQESMPVQPLLDGVFVHVINGSRRQSAVPIAVGAVLPTGFLFPGNSLATTLPVGSVPYTINGAAGNLTTRFGERTLAVYAEGGGAPNVFEITTPPLIPLAGSTSRRVVNATEDVRSLSICIDSIPKITGDGDHLARNVSYGTTSAVSVSNQDRRGTYYVYDAETLALLYSLPVQFAPMGNNYTFVVIGRKDTGYEVIVSQEF
ncbi:MAG: DUF4397 domain-containing protein [Candidatus Kapabacteria bacterium]|nr:DUF4397 domain-containing protein [Candidatus Kapabacteria bacterium]